MHPKLEWNERYLVMQTVTQVINAHASLSVKDASCWVHYSYVNIDVCVYGHEDMLAYNIHGYNIQAPTQVPKSM